MTTLQPGQMLGPYQITSQIGKGGMATVYKAYQVAMDRYVALKVVAAQLADDPNFMQRFRQEARMIAKLEHPHILPVHDFGEADGTPYMVMRFLEAGTLNERLDAGQLTLPEIDRIFSQLTEALEYAHENGVIHRDIKPSNAMLDRRGDVFLTDFGIAKMLEGSSGLTATGAITGTPAYMSPEQAQGNKVDQRSDIYSLGIVLFEMLTGRVPFEAETPMAVLFKQIQDPPPPLSFVRSDLPYSLESVLLKAMAKNPTERYDSMKAFRAGWKSALAEASQAAPVSLPPARLNVPDEVAPLPAPSIQQGEPKAPTGQVGAQGEALPGAGAVPTAAKPMFTPAPPAKKGFKWKALLGVGLPICLLVLCLSLAYVFRRQLFVRFLQGPATVRATQTAQLGAIITPPAEETSPLSSGKHTSWAAANSVFSIGFRDDEVLAAGMGGITVWNRRDGSYKQFTTADGLPSANAGAIFVDSDGSVWIGTDAGLVRSNGGQHTVYTTDQGLDSNYVVAIARSGDRILAGTQYSGGAGSGLLALNGGPSTGSGQVWQQVPGFPSSEKPDDESVSYNVRQIVTDKEGYLWVPTDAGLAMLDGDKQWNVFKTGQGLPDNNVYTVFADSAGNVWAGTGNGGLAKFNNEKWAFESFADLKEHSVYDVYCILEDKDGNLWFAGGNVARYNPNTKEWEKFSADEGTLPVYSVHSAGIDDQGNLYFGTDESGLARYRGGKFDVWLVPNVPHYGQYGRVLAAPDGKLLFVQLYESGVDQFDPANKSWTKVPQDRYVPRAFDAQGRMWSGGSDGLWIFGPEKTTHVTTDHGLPSNRVNGIVFNANGEAYIATEAGIVLFDGLDVKDTYTAAKDGLVSDETYTLFMASDGSLWASLYGGFSRRLPDGSWQHFTSEKLFGGFSQYFPAFAEDAAGTIWVTTLGDGLYSFGKGEPKRMLSTDPGVGLPSNYLTDVTVAPDGALWIGTDGQGAVRYDGSTLRPGSGQAWQHYGVKDGLLHPNVNWIYVEPGGAVWFTTNGGITRLQP